jgi:hypothetical protein
MARSRTTRPEEQALDDALRAMFTGVEARVVPDSLRQLIDQLEEASATPEEKAA